MKPYRIALRPHEPGGSGPTDQPLDDIVVNGVSMFRMEDMGDHFWMCCYLSGTDERISFNVRIGGDGEPLIVVEATELPDVRYEERSS